MKGPFYHQVIYLSLIRMFISSSPNHVDGSVSVDLSAALNFEQAGVSKRARKAASAALSGHKANGGGRQLFSFRFGRLTHFLSCAYLCTAWVWSDGGRLRDSCFAPERPVPHTGSPRGQELAGSVYWMCAWMGERGVKELLVHKRLARSKEQWIVSDCIIWISLSHVSGRQLVKTEIPRQIFHCHEILNGHSQCSDDESCWLWQTLDFLSWATTGLTSLFLNVSTTMEGY